MSLIPFSRTKDQGSHNAQGASSADSTSVSEMLHVEASELLCHATESKRRVASRFWSFSDEERLSIFVQKLLYQPEAVVRTSSAIVCGGFGADEIAGLTRTMVWRRHSLSRTKIFRRVARKALSCPRMFDHAFCRSPLTCFNRLGAPPRLCFEKYVDVS